MKARFASLLVPPASRAERWGESTAAAKPLG
jgi:hypothetical protein